VLNGRLLRLDLLGLGCWLGVLRTSLSWWLEGFSSIAVEVAKLEVQAVVVNIRGEFAWQNNWAKVESCYSRRRTGKLLCDRSFFRWLRFPLL